MCGTFLFFCIEIPLYRILSSLVIPPVPKRLQPESPLDIRCGVCVNLLSSLCFFASLFAPANLSSAHGFSFSPWWKQPLTDTNASSLATFFFSELLFTFLCSSFRLPMIDKSKDLPLILGDSGLKHFVFFLFTPLNHRQFKLLHQMQNLGGLHIKPVSAINSSMLIKLLEVSLTINQPLRGEAKDR